MAKSYPQAKIKSSRQVTLVNIPDVLPANDRPPMTDGQRLSANIIDFLVGVCEERWKASSLGEREEYFQKTGDPISNKQIRKIRSELVRLGWAIPSTQGYRLVMPAEDILKKMGFSSSCKQ